LRSLRCRFIRTRPADRVRPLAAENRKRRGLGKPETFNFLGFTFICGKSRRGKLPDQTEVPARPHAGKAPGHQGGAATAHASADPRTGKWLKQVVTGYFNYHAVPTNSRH
jgi:RNA-directed DNA polymerase